MSLPVKWRTEHRGCMLHELSHYIHGEGLSIFNVMCNSTAIPQKALLWVLTRCCFFFDRKKMLEKLKTLMQVEILRPIFFPLLKFKVFFKVQIEKSQQLRLLMLVVCHWILWALNGRQSWSTNFLTFPSSATSIFFFFKSIVWPIKRLKKKSTNNSHHNFLKPAVMLTCFVFPTVKNEGTQFIFTRQRRTANSHN